MNGLKTMAGKCILYIIYSVQFHCEQEKKTQMLRKKNKTIAGDAARSGRGPGIRPAALGNEVPTIRSSALENPMSGLNQTYQIPDETRSAI